MKIFRWWGILGFIVIVSLIGFFWLMMVDQMIERAIEKNGTKIMGAKVQLDGADLSFSPLGLELIRLQVTDKDEPMKNAVEIKRIAMSFDLIRLISRKVIIEEMTMTGMAFHTPRKTSGAISNQRTSSKEGLRETLGLPSLDIPDVRDILEKENLKTLQQVEAIQKEFETGEAKWKQTVSELPDKEKLTAYRLRINELKSAKSGKVEDVLKAKADFETLRADIKREVERIKQAEKDLKTDLQKLNGQVEAVAKAPQEDIEHLAQKYSLTPEGLTKMARTLFGGEVATMINTGFRWYDKFKPVQDWIEEKQREQAAKPKEIKPERFKGINVRFREREPLPDFLIRKIHISARAEAGAFSGLVRDVTGDQPILGRPTTFQFSGRQMSRMESFSLSGMVNRLNPNLPIDQANLKIQDFGLKTFHLAKSEQFPVVLTHGMTDLTAKVTLGKSSVAANFGANFGPITISAGPKDSNKPLVLALAGALMDVKAFGLTAQIAGTRDDYDIQMQSDLDEILKAAMENRVREQVELLKGRLKEKIMERVGKPIAELRLKLGTFAPLLDDLVARGKIGDELLQKHLNEAKDMAEERAKEKLKKEEEKQKEKLKQQLKDKLKLPF
ncbi:MAG: TIGR03545 family protein [Nitrospirota bacterium]